MKIYVCYREYDYEGCSAPWSAHLTLEAAQQSFVGVKDWKGPSADMEWSSKVMPGEYVMIAELEVEP